MAGTIVIIRGFPMAVNYQPYISFGYQSISYCTLPIEASIGPGEYAIPEDQRTNLDWFYDNDFRFNQYGRNHVGALMADEEPDTVLVY